MAQRSTTSSRTPSRSPRAVGSLCGAAQFAQLLGGRQAYERPEGPSAQLGAALNQAEHLGSDAGPQVEKLKELRDASARQALPARDLGSVYTFTLDCGSHGLRAIE